MRTRSSTTKEQKLEAPVVADKVASSPQSKTPRLIAPSQQNPLVDLPKPPHPISPGPTPCLLPPELLNQIFDSISLNRDFASLALASRRFLHLARSHLYHTIALDLSDHAEGYYRERKPWEERIGNWFIPPIVRTLSKQPACALHVKTVEVRYRSKVIYDNRGGYREFETFAPTPQVVFDTLEEALRNLSNLYRIYSECTQRFDYESNETLAALLVKYCPKLEILDLPSATFNFASSLSLLTRLPLLKEIRSNLCTDYPIPRSTSTMSSALLHTLRFSRAIGNPRALPWILHLSANTLHTLSIRLQDCDGIRQFKRKHRTKAQPVDLSFLSNLRHLTIHVRASSALPATLKSTLNLPITHLTLIAHDIVLSKVRFLHLLPRQLEHLSIGPSGYMRLLDWSPLLLPSNPCPNLKIVELAGGGNPETCSKTTFDVNSTAEVPIKYGFEVRWIIETLAKDPFVVGNTLRKNARIVKDGPVVHWEEEEDVYAPQRLEGWRITDFAPRKSGQEESFEQRRLRKEPPER